MANTGTTRDIAVVVGSLRRDSFNRRIALELAELAPDTLALEIVPIGQLALYNQESDEHPPTAYSEFRERIRRADGVLFVTPEYNRSVPGVLKNAIDVGSRPYGRSVWNGKPGGVVSVSIGGAGGFGANHHLRQSLAYLNVPTLAAPEVYIGHADKLFGDDGRLSAESTRDFLRKYVAAYAGWVEKILAK